MSCNRFLKSFFIVLFIVLLNISNCFCLYKNYSIGLDKDSMTVTGDSYAGYFAVFESNRDYNINLFAEAGKTTRDNQDMMVKAIFNGDEIILISIGVNDRFANESLDIFGLRMESMVILANMLNKKVFFHTYMDYGMKEVSDDIFVASVSNNTDLPFQYSGMYLDNQSKMNSCSDYDKILLDVANRYGNAFYIDMKDFNNMKYLQDDSIHYNKAFYDALYDRIIMSLFLIK